MTLGRLVAAWAAVAAWFLVAPPIGYRVDFFAGPKYFVWSYNRWAVTGRLAEAVLVTLFASLWFDSLGSGGWWLLFLFVGLIAAYPVRVHYLTAFPDFRRRELLAGLLDLARYLVAGGILAWRLG